MGRLFITDLDGTLLTPESRVSPESAAIITGLSRRGALISVATARTPATVEPLLAMTYTSVPLIVFTGAAMWDRVERRLLSPAVVPGSLVSMIAERFRSHGVNPFIYNYSTTPAPGIAPLRVYHCVALTSDERTFYTERRALQLKQFIFTDNDPSGSPAGEETILLLGIGPTPVIHQLAADLSGDPGLSVSAYPDIFDRERSYIEVFRSGISKAAAVSRLKEMTGADHVTVYGDSLNDLPMFAVADEAVAVANALPEVIAAATRVIGPNTSPSVAEDIANKTE